MPRTKEEGHGPVVALFASDPALLSSLRFFLSLEDYRLRSDGEPPAPGECMVIDQTSAIRPCMARKPAHGRPCVSGPVARHASGQHRPGMGGGAERAADRQTADRR